MWNYKNHNLTRNFSCHRSISLGVSSVCNNDRHWYDFKILTIHYTGIHSKLYCQNLTFAIIPERSTFIIEITSQFKYFSRYWDKTIKEYLTYRRQTTRFLISLMCSYDLLPISDPLTESFKNKPLCYHRSFHSKLKIPTIFRWSHSDVILQRQMKQR